jgi:D-alanine--poly(phosphoribitol) ligase subunit 2
VNNNDQLRDYIQREIANGREVSDDESLLEAGILDSLAIVKLVAHIEDEFGVEIPDSDFDPDNFESISAIVKLLDRIRV